ncbi:hypothetical protein H3N56_11100 [Cetobacterium sp. 2A]|uniref:hypothetical protein n=1 Tax=Cetobacterium sp. 2A TaxID=2754723 RepID=UPI00163D0D80|nr:hypothetical protein [Cetobacterium sp. 2A]MBC2856979.1 hypothetical protein [Cetobacterium sp. 2A]
MAKKKKILIGIIGTALFGIAFSFIQKPLNNRKVLNVIQQEIPDDKFYFIRGLDRDRSLSTNIRYRGIVYSDKLKAAESFSGIQVALENLNKAHLYGSEFKRQYEGALAYPLATAPMKENAKKIFGNDIIVYVDFPMIWDLKGQTEFVQNNIGKETDQIANMTGYIDVFVDDITKVDIDEYKKKLFDLHQKLYKTYNIDSILHLDVQDKKYLTHEQIESNIFYIFKDEPKVKELLKKHKENRNLNADELGYLTSYFVKYFEDEQASKISFEAYSYFVKKYQDINVILPKEMRKID